jgi:archaellum component FlaD/FlaE
MFAVQTVGEWSWRSAMLNKILEYYLQLPVVGQKAKIQDLKFVGPL